MEAGALEVHVQFLRNDPMRHSAEMVETFHRVSRKLEQGWRPDPRQ
jgi:hypothetical protein